MKAPRSPWFAPTALLSGAVLLAGLASIVISGGCRKASSTDHEKAGRRGLQVVATLPVLAFLARDVGGADVHASSLLPAAASPHTFEPTTGDVQRASTAALFLSAGAGLDSWAEGLRSREQNGGRLRISDLPGLDPIVGAHGNDPHVWLDPVRVRDVIVPALADSLAALDPSHAAQYHVRARALSSQLTRLDIDIRTSLARAPQRGYVAFHNAWRYFAQRYDLHELGVVEESPGEEPSPRDLARLARRAKKAHASAILIEPQFDPRSARTLASEFGGTTIIVDPLGDWSDPARNDYTRLIRFNARAFALALGAVNQKGGKP